MEERERRRGRVTSAMTKIENCQLLVFISLAIECNFHPLQHLHQTIQDWTKNSVGFDSTSVYLIW